MAVTTIGTTAERLRDLILIRKRKKLEKLKLVSAKAWAIYEHRYSVHTYSAYRRVLLAVFDQYDEQRAVIEQQADLELRDLDVRLQNGGKK